MQVVKRSAGRSATAAAAYRHGERIVDERTGQINDYTRKQNVDASFILAPASSPSWTKDRSQLWNKAELAEKRKDARVAREVQVALPRELSKSVQEQLVRDFAGSNFVRQGMVADVAIHRTKASDGQEQPHAHIMLTLRPLDGPEFSAKKDRSWNDKKNVENWRASWAELVNRAYEVSQVQANIDHRSYKKQGIKKIPQTHMGSKAWAMEKRGIKTILGDRNRWIAEINKLYEQAKKKLLETAKAARSQLENAAKQARKSLQIKELTLAAGKINQKTKNRGRSKGFER